VLPPEDHAADIFGRGIAARRLGRVEDAEADFAAAPAIDPNVEDRFKRWGVTR
jgi:hypothetical protein